MKNFSFSAVPGMLIAACLAGAAAVAAERSNSCTLTAVDVIDSTPGEIRIALTIEGQVLRVETLRFDDGRFVFDLEGVAWNGPTRRVRPDGTGIHEYRFSQFSRDPLVTRFVVEVGGGWSCRHDPSPNGLFVLCIGPPNRQESQPSVGIPTIAVVRGIEITSPLAGLDAEKLVDRSLASTPGDIVRDGLPHFGSMRDDWIGAPRPHKGLDIYVDKITVQAAAEGKVSGTGHGERAGGWAKIDHGNGVETVYVHVSGLRIKTGDEVARGQHIAAVNGAAGNAVEAQLHFELRLDGQSVDPVPYIFELGSEDLRRKITSSNEKLAGLEQQRAARVRQMPHE